MFAWKKRAMALALCLAMVLSMAACGGDPAETTAPTTQSVPETTLPPETTEPVVETQPVENEFEVITLNVTESAEPGNPLPFRELTVEQIVAEMGTGWNLGNTMDGHSGFTPNETLWQDDETTQALLDAVHDLGFNTVRIPITWGTMINDDYSIKDKWISRVEDIVDYCIRQDMYVIINIHHDGAEQSGWIRVATDDLPAMYEKYEGVWKSIAERFKNYDEHLIFESMNEVCGDDSTGVAYDTAVIMNLNQIFVNVVRSSGSNNARRWLSVPGRYTNTKHMTDPEYGFELPADTVQDRIFASVHYYDWSFGMETSMTKTVFDEPKVQTLADDFQKLITRFTSQGIPVIMGEYGAVNKNNPEQRAYHNEVFNLLAKQAGVVPVYWDQGWYDRSATPADYSFTLVDRKTYQSVEKIVTDGLMRGFFAEDEADVWSLVVSPEVIAISDVTLAQDSVALTIGEVYYPEYTVAPENTNDVLLWKTSDPSVATVYNGMIRARGIGTATVTAFSQSGGVEKTVTVTVNPVSGDGTTVINAAGSITLEEGSYLFAAPQLTGGEGLYITYRIADPAVATVSTLGKVVAIAPGETVLTLTASDGTQLEIPVTVTEKALGAGLTIAINVLYNDNALSYFGNEIGEIITIHEEGQYSLTFDCGQHLSAAAKDLGVTGIQQLTAIYLKDYMVTSGEQKKSNLVSCDIRWDKIVVDGVELTIVKPDFKSGIKSSGIFDTNDPFNSWDGSAVEEVTVKSHVLDINLENPQTVTITFTISNLEFAE